ncbi:hypothetical protein [Streptomyces sp. NPDC002346]
MEIEAIQFIGAGSADRIKATFGADVQFGTDCLLIDTLEGSMRADLGDWIIQGVQGEVYPCKPDIFATTYDEVAETHVITDEDQAAFDRALDATLRRMQDPHPSVSVTITTNGGD